MKKMLNIVTILIALLMVFGLATPAIAAEVIPLTVKITASDTAATAYEALKPYLKEGSVLDGNHFAGYLKAGIVIDFPKGWTLYNGQGNSKKEYVGPTALTYKSGGAHIEIWAPEAKTTTTATTASTTYVAKSLEETWKDVQALSCVNSTESWAGIQGTGGDRHINVVIKSSSSGLKYEVPSGYKLILDGKSYAAGTSVTIPAGKTAELWKVA